MTLWLFAFGAGMLATVNPCGFAMLPAFMAYYLGDHAGTPSAGTPSAGTPSAGAPLATRLAQGLSVGAAMSAGFAAVFTVTGLLVAFGLRTVVGAVPWAAVVIGGLLTVLGLVMLSGREVKLRLGATLGTGPGRGHRHMVVFGAAYAVASLSCTLAVLLAVIAQATATANPLQLIAVFAAYALGASTVLVGLAVSAALAKASLARAARRVLPYATRLGGAVLVLSGIYLILYWLPSLTGDGRRPSAVSGVGDGLSARATTFLEANQGGVAAVAAAVVCLAAVLVALQRRRRHPAATSPDGAHCCEPADAAAGVGQTGYRADRAGRPARP